MSSVTIYFDGACEPVNPGGVCSWGFVVYDEDGDEVHAACGVVGARGKEATNNVAEWSAFLFALRWVKDNAQQGSFVQVFGDSKLVVETYSGRWRAKSPNNVAALAAAEKIRHTLRAKQIQVSVSWVPREQNERADELSKQAYTERTGKPAPKGNEHHKRRGRRRCAAQSERVWDDDSLEEYEAMTGKEIGNK